jgi:hypothetical protein
VGILSNTPADATFTVGDICKRVYGVSVVEGRHRAAVNRALRIVLPKAVGWSRDRLWSDGRRGAQPEYLIYQGDPGEAYRRHASRVSSTRVRTDT